MKVKWHLLLLWPVVAFTSVSHLQTRPKTIPFEAAFQGLCENNELCDQLCLNLHDGTFECDCKPGFVLDSNGYSCSRGSRKAVVEPFSPIANDRDEGALHKLVLQQKLQELWNGDKSPQSDGNNETRVESAEDGLNSSQNFNQKLPSQSPACQLDCDSGRCVTHKHYGTKRCQCPLGRIGHSCSIAPKIDNGRFHGNSWAAFPPLKEAYRDVQLTLEFLPHSPKGILLVSGESDDLSGDFMSLVLIEGHVFFKWDCGSGAGSVGTPGTVMLNEWNRITIYRHRWDVWMQLNSGHHVQGRSKGLFSRITFREPLYVGGAYNLTSLFSRLGVNSGFDGCIKRLRVNDHEYKFYKKNPSEIKGVNQFYAAVAGWDITECRGEICSEVECLHGGKCIVPSFHPHHSISNEPFPACLCPLGYAGDICEKQLNLEVPFFNGSSLLVFPPIGGRALSWLELEIIFRPSSSDGIILYAGHRADGTGDFLAVNLFQSHVILIITLGSGPLTLRSLLPISSNTWHTVYVSRTGRRTWLYVDNQLPVEGMTPGAFTMLSLTQPLYLGGLNPSDFPPAILPQTSSFVGCIQKLTLGGENVDLVSGAISGSNVGSCDHPCSSHLCDHGGICTPQKDSFSCKCPLGFQGPRCKSQIVAQLQIPFFNGKSFMKFKDPDTIRRMAGDQLELWMRFRSLAPDGLLLWIGAEEPLADLFSLALQNGKLVLGYDLGSGSTHLVYNSSDDLSDGAWHSIKLSRFERATELTVDSGSTQRIVALGELIQLNVVSPLYIGGLEASMKEHDLPGFKGCITDLVLSTSYYIDLISQSETTENIDYC